MHADDSLNASSLLVNQPGALSRPAGLLTVMASLLTHAWENTVRHCAATVRVSDAFSARLTQV